MYVARNPFIPSSHGTVNNIFHTSDVAFPIDICQAIQNLIGHLAALTFSFP
jgi:hypothetical protein